eukprot:scaffold95994_cov54-Phaeocystis_antarctica.AAC.2
MQASSLSAELPTLPSDLLPAFRDRDAPPPPPPPEEATAEGEEAAAGTAADRSGAAAAAGVTAELKGAVEVRVGGLERQLDSIVRRVLASRADPAAARRLGVSHVRGILLSGPPGCGKTLLARELARSLGSREPQIVNGPEIMDKFVGEAEKRVRELFAPAEVPIRASVPSLACTDTTLAQTPTLTLTLTLTLTRPSTPRRETARRCMSSSSMRWMRWRGSAARSPATRRGRATSAVEPAPSLQPCAPSLYPAYPACNPQPRVILFEQVRDSVVNQLLAKMDGVVEAGNVLVIGLTNRQAYPSTPSPAHSPQPSPAQPSRRPPNPTLTGPNTRCPCTDPSCSTTRFCAPVGWRCSCR